VWVQDPDEAAVEVMPRAALQLAGADRTLRLLAMAQVLSA